VDRSGDRAEWDDDQSAEPFAAGGQLCQRCGRAFASELCDVLDMAALTRYELVRQSLFLKT